MSAAIDIEDFEDTALVGTDLTIEIRRTRVLNQRLAAAFGFMSLSAVLMFGIAIHSIGFKVDPVRVAVDQTAHVYGIDTTAAGEPADAKITMFVGNCINGVLNASFANYKNTVSRSVGECFTGGGTASVMKEIEPFLQSMKTNRTNLVTQFTVLPFINTRTEPTARTRSYKVQGVVALSYIGEQTSTRPLSYSFEANVVRVPYESSIYGIRLESITMKQQNIS